MFSSNSIIVSCFGVSGEILPDGQFSIISPYWKETFPSYSHFYNNYGLQPVRFIDKKYGVESFLRIDRSGAILRSSTQEMEIQNMRGRVKDNKHNALNRILFYLGALKHHFSTLVNSYINVANFYAENFFNIPNSNPKVENITFYMKDHKFSLDWIASVPVSGVSICSYGSAHIIFYAMMSYLASARSSLDALLPVLKACPSIKIHKNSNGSFNKFINSVIKEKSQVPDQLKDCLVDNWNLWTQKLIYYRDTAIHYEVLAPNAWPSSIITYSGNKMVALQAWLPDNPEARAHRNYKFNNYIEYLGYAQETYFNVLDLIIAVFNNTLIEA